MTQEDKRSILPKALSARLLRQYRKWQGRTPVFLRNLGSRIDPETIFICGNYKTGSTAIGALLALAAGQKRILDIFWRTPGSVKIKLLKKELPLEWYVNRYRYLFSKKIVKEPDLIFYMDQLLALFPRGRYVFLLRDPRDNIRSILNTIHLPGNAEDLTEEQLNALPGSIWRLAMEGRLFGVQGENYIATQALRWNRILELYERYADQMILLKYETFRQNKAAEIYALAEQLGLPIKANIASRVDDQYQPKGDHSVTWLEFFGRDNLATIESICRKKMEQYGYPVS